MTRTKTNKKIRWMVFAAALAVAVLGLVSGIAFASHGGDIDVTDPLEVVEHDGSFYIQGPLPSSAGTGLIDPFLTDGGGGSQDVTRSYNTDGTAEFDTVTGGGRTHSLSLAAVPELERDGVIYKEFVLDINKAPGGSPYLAMNELQLWLTADANLTGYDLGTYSFPSGATKVFDLDEGSDGDIAVLMDYSNESGSGAADLTWLVPISEFEPLGDCNYGNPDCATFVVLFNEYGNYTEDGADPDKWVNNDGFEEWGTVLRPVVSVTKDAAGTFDRTIDWEILKSVLPDSHDLFAGGSGTSGYSITVTKSETVDNVAVSGTITILNPTGGNGNPIEDSIPAEILSVEDVINQDGVLELATVDCGVAFPYTLGAGDTLVCTYTASPDTGDEGVNTATVTIEALADTSEYAGTADVAFTENVIGFDEINVDDTNDDGDFGPVGGTTTHTYTDEFDCENVTYVDGVAQYEVPNTATIIEEDESSSALVTVTCFAPVVAKDADGSYDERHDWDVEKTVSPTSQTGVAGESLSWTWTIDVFETIVDQNYAVTGEIDVTNPAGSPGDMTVSLVDELNDGTLATVDCGAGATSVTVAPGATETCSYDADTVDDSATLNTATATFNSIDFIATADVAFTKNVVNGSATVSDEEIGLSGVSVSGGDQFTGPDGAVCSSNPDDYGDNGQYNGGDANLATLIDSEGTVYDDGAVTSWTCYAPVVVKDAAGSYDERHDWNVVKTVLPTSQTGLAGDPLSWEWTIDIIETTQDQNYAVTGDIDVTNPAGSPGDMTVSLVDELSDGTLATVDCGAGATSVTVAPGATETCSYTASPADDAATLNTAVADFEGIFFVATADVAFTKNVVNGSATVSDEEIGLSGVSVSGGDQFTGPDGDVCSSNPDAYGDNGQYNGSDSNLATLVDSEGTAYEDGATTGWTCYAPVVVKDAAGSYDERHDWNVVKTVLPTSQTGLAGDPLSWEWTIDIIETTQDQNYAVTGDIDVTNPAGSPGDMTVSLVDELSDGTLATVDCGAGATSVTVAPGATETCSYSASPADDAATLNTAVADFEGIFFVATADVAFTKNVVNGSATVSDEEIGLSGVSVSGGDQFTGPDGDVCSSNPDAYGDNGQYNGSDSNLATLVDSEGTAYEDGATTTWTCFAPVVAKEVITSTSTQDFSWEIFKGEDAIYHLFAGDDVVHSYDIELIKSLTPGGITYKVDGFIYVTNPSGEDMTVDVSDVLNDGTIATVNCGAGATSVTVAAGDTATCAYQALPATGTASENKATATLNGIDFEAFADVIYEVIPVDDQVTVTDDYGSADPAEALHFGPFFDSALVEYDRTFTCPTDPGAYDNGVYSEIVVNTATIDQTGDNDNATVELFCYLPGVDKDAAGTYDETHTWDVEKTVNPASQVGGPGVNLSWLWTVEVSETSVEENFDVTGSIYVENLNPVAPMTVSLSDVLNGTTATITGCVNGVFADPFLTVEPGATATCSYEALDIGGFADTNTATATLESGVSVSWSADIGWTANVINGTATLTDDQSPLNESLTAGQGPWTFTYDQGLTCSTERSAYEPGGSYGDTVLNTAIIAGSNGQADQSSASTAWTCEAGFVDVLKLVGGIEVTDQTWTFELRQGGATLETQTTPPALMQFQTALTIGQTYTMCEIGLPVAWTANWLLDGVAVTPYIPGLDNSVQCVDFVAEQGLSSFVVDNIPEGGEPRTIGYWKNWNTCSNGNQVQTAANNGGFEEGFWLLNDVLPITLGGWDDDGTLQYVVDECAEGKQILNKLGTNKKGDRFLKAAKDAAYNMAAQLLAAKANVAAGATTCPAALDAIAAADALLVEIEWDRVGWFLPPNGKKGKNPLRPVALDLANTLDEYNNGYLCGP